MEAFSGGHGLGGYCILGGFRGFFSSVHVVGVEIIEREEISLV